MNLCDSPAATCMLTQLNKLHAMHNSSTAIMAFLALSDLGNTTLKIRSHVDGVSKKGSRGEFCNIVLFSWWWLDCGSHQRPPSTPHLFSTHYNLHAVQCVACPQLNINMDYIWAQGLKQCCMWPCLNFNLVNGKSKNSLSMAITSFKQIISLLDQTMVKILMLLQGDVFYGGVSRFGKAETGNSHGVGRVTAPAQ